MLSWTDVLQQTILWLTELGKKKSQGNFIKDMLFIYSESYIDR